MRQQLVNVTSPVRRQPGARITADGFAEREADKAMINDARQAHEDHDASITRWAPTKATTPRSSLTLCKR